MGFDLNRHWQEPSPWAHPTLYATKNLLLEYDRDDVSKSEYSLKCKIVADDIMSPHLRGGDIVFLVRIPLVLASALLYHLWGGGGFWCGSRWC